MQKRSREKAVERHANVLRQLVRRYVTAEQRKRDDFGITEDDVMEIRQDISTLRYELIDIFKKNGMKTPKVDNQENLSEHFENLKIFYKYLQIVFQFQYLAKKVK